MNNLDRFPLGVWETDNSGRDEAPEDSNAPDYTEIEKPSNDEASKDAQNS